MADSVADLVARIGAAAEAVADAEDTGVSRAAIRMKRTIEGSRDRVTGDGRLSGVGNAKLGVKYELKPGSALMTATGPWQLIERDTKSAGIVTGKVGRVRGRGARRATRERNLNIAFGVTGSLSGVSPLAWSGGPHPFARVKDAPTKGQFPWKKGTESGTPAAVSEIKNSTLNAFRGAFS